MRFLPACHRLVEARDWRLSMLCFSYSSACPGATRGQSVGFPLKEGLGKHCPGVSLHARRIILGPKWSLVCQRVRAGSSRLDERLMTSWTGMQFQRKYFVYISGLGCIWCLALHATGDACRARAGLQYSCQSGRSYVRYVHNTLLQQYKTTRMCQARVINGRANSNIGVQRWLSQSRKG